MLFDPESASVHQLNELIEKASDALAKRITDNTVPFDSTYTIVAMCIDGSDEIIAEHIIAKSPEAAAEQFMNENSDLVVQTVVFGAVQTSSV